MVAVPAEPVEIPNKLTRFIYITGCDGTGKTTQTCLLLEKLQAAGVRTRHVWLRFPFCFSLPLLAYARWRGLSWYEQSGAIRHGYWDFSRSRLLRDILPWLLLLDASLAGFTKIYLPIWRGETVVCERFVLDILVDLSVAIRDPFLSSRLPGKLFLNLIPDNAKIVILDLDDETICNRRPNLVFDHALASRLEAYRLLATQLKLPVIDSHQSIHAVRQEFQIALNLL